MASILSALHAAIQEGEVELLDLTHSLNPKIPTFMGECGYSSHHVLHYGEDLFATQKLEMVGGAGTHLDAPLHRFEGLMDVASIPLTSLIAPLCVVDVTRSVQANPDYEVTLADVKEYEDRFGPIPAGAFLFFYTGWSTYWSRSQCYRNLDGKGNMCFPRVSPRIAEEYCGQLKGIGVDTLSPDGGDISRGFPVHEVLLSQGRLILENLGPMERLTPVGAYLWLAPLKMEGGTEAPVRAIAMQEKSRITLP